MVLYPGNLWYLLLLVPVVYLFFKNFRKGKHDLLKIDGKWRKHQLNDVYLLKWFFSFLFFVLFILFTVLALTGFVKKRREIMDLPPKGDIVFVFDISRSMLCDDIPPGRLQKSLQFAKGIMGELPAVRYGIVVFKGSGVQLVPVTEDSEAVVTRLASISPDTLTSKGTDIEEGLKTAAASFPSGDDRRRYVLLFTDGGELSGNVRDVVKLFKEKNIDPVIIGTGTQEGKELKDSKGKTVVDKAGKAVIVKLDPSVLTYFAAETKGHYFDIAKPGSFGRVMNVLSSEISHSRITIVQDDAYLFSLVFALVFLFLHISIRIFPWKGVF